MSQYDCNKLLDYKHEIQRMCKAVTCEECPLAGRGCRTINKLTQDEIDLLQEWSDENPEEEA